MSDMPHAKYCCVTHKYYAYRKRRLERAKVKICKQCGKPWKEPISTNGKTPNYCADCQAYFQSHYKNVSATKME